MTTTKFGTIDKEEVSLKIKVEYFWDNDKGNEFWSLYEKMPFKQYDTRMWPIKGDSYFRIFIKYNDEIEIDRIVEYFRDFIDF